MQCLSNVKNTVMTINLNSGLICRQGKCFMLDWTQKNTLQSSLSVILTNWISRPIKNHIKI